MSDSEPDALDRLAELVLAEGALSAEGLPAFVAALRERAALILEERVAALEERTAHLEKRATSAEKKAAWIAEAKGELEKEAAWLRETVGNLEQEQQKLQELTAESGQAHARLLAHHRGLVGEVLRSLEDLSEGLGAASREEVDVLLDTLRKELG